MGLDEPPFKPGLFKNRSSTNTKYNSLHRSNTVENPHPHIALIQSPVKSSATKIIYAVDLIHVMLSRSVLAVFMKCKIIPNYVVNISHYHEVITKSAWLHF